MKLCYCDESGTGDEPFVVMVGVIVDSQRMHVTKADWVELLKSLSLRAQREITELHTRDFYSGNGAWRGISGPDRAAIIGDVFDWLAARRHHIVYCGVDKQKYHASRNAGQIPAELSTLWRFMGMHLLLSVQKAFQSKEGTKGNTIFVFDNEEREQMRFTDLIQNPPAWTDAYYQKKKKQARLDQVVDVPYFGDSKEVSLLQLADFIAYFLRRHVEVVSGAQPPRYADEPARLSAWMNVLIERSINGSNMYPAVGRCECSELFFGHAPPAMVNLHRTQSPPAITAVTRMAQRPPDAAERQFPMEELGAENSEDPWSASEADE